MKYKTRQKKKSRTTTRKKQRGGQTKKNYIDYPLQFVSGLVHGTTYEYAINILKSGFLEARPGTHHYVLNGIETSINKGVFLQAFFRCSNQKEFIKQTLPYSLFQVNFLFSNKLLVDREDWYFTNNWVGGIKFPPAEPKRIRLENGKEQDIYHSYSKSMFNQFIEKYYDNICAASPFYKNEVVFEKNVSLDYLKAIYIYDYENLTFYSHKKVTNQSGKETIERKPFVNTEKPDVKCASLKSVLAELGYSHIPVFKVSTKLPFANNITTTTTGNC